MDRVSPHRVPSERGQAAGSEPFAVRSPAMPAGYRPKGVIGSEAGHAKPGRGGIRPEELRQLSENRHAYPERRSGRLRAAGVLASRLGMRTRPGTWPQRSFSSGSRSLTERSLPVDESPALGSMTGVIRLLLRVDVPASWTCEMRRRCSQGAVGALLRLCQCASGPPSHEVGREPAQLPRTKRFHACRAVNSRRRASNGARWPRHASPLRVPNDSRSISGRSRHETNLFGSRDAIQAADGIER